MKYLRSLIVGLLALTVAAPANAADVSGTNYVQGQGGYYRKDDRSGPYTLDSAGNATLIGAGGGGGGGGTGGSVTAGGTPGTSAQAVQGIPNGVPQNVTVGNQTLSGSSELDVRGSGTLAAGTVGSSIIIPLNGQATVGLTFTGLTASGATVTYEQSNDGGTTYTGVNEVNAGTGVPLGTRTTDGQTRVSMSGRTNLRLRVSTAGTGSVGVAWTVSVREGLFTLASPLPPGANVIGSVNAATDGTTPRQVLSTTTGALEPPTVAAGKITRTSTALTANTSTTIVAANINRISLGIQCGSGGVSVDETGGALTAASVGNGTLFIPTGTGPYFTPPVATRTAITAYTSTAQTCVVTEYLR